MKKVTHIKTNNIDVKVRWNPKVTASLSACLIGLVLILCFSKNASTRNTSIISIVVVLVVLIAYSLIGLKYDVSDEEQKDVKSDKTVDDAAPANTEAPADVGEVKRSVKKSDGSNSTAVIRNKVPVPNPPTCSETDNSGNDLPPSSAEEDSSAINDKRSIPLTDMSEEDWDDMFDLDD